jgi:hypothetical protein
MSRGRWNSQDPSSTASSLETGGHGAQLARARRRHRHHASDETPAGPSSGTAARCARKGNPLRLGSQLKVLGRAIVSRLSSAFIAQLGVDALLIASVLPGAPPEHDAHDCKGGREYEHENDPGYRRR